MFTDLVGSTALASRLDPEDWREILVAYQEQVAKVIESFGGRVTQFQGDGVVAYFGWPHGPTPPAATPSPPALRSSTPSPRWAKGNPRCWTGSWLPRRDPHRSGCHRCGRGGRSQATRPTFSAKLPASRLASRRRPDPARSSSATRRLHWLPDGLSWSPLVLPRSGASTASIPVHRVLARLGTRSALEAKDLAPFVGRRPELRALVSHWQAARLGRARTVLVLGEPGIGKSRLAREFAAPTESERRFPSPSIALGSTP